MGLVLLLLLGTRPYPIPVRRSPLLSRKSLTPPYPIPLHRSLLSSRMSRNSPLFLRAPRRKTPVAVLIRMTQDSRHHSSELFSEIRQASQIIRIEKKGKLQANLTHMSSSHHFLRCSRKTRFEFFRLLLLFPHSSVFFVFYIVLLNYFSYNNRFFLSVLLLGIAFIHLISSRKTKFLLSIRYTR